MSNRSARDPRDLGLPDEDDWFSSPPDAQAETGEVAWQDDLEPRPRPASDGLGRRQAMVVLASVAAVVLIAAGILVVSSIGGSDTKTSASAPATPPVATTPARTTPTTPSAASVPTDAVLRAGSSGTAVVALQKALTKLGYTPGTADGKFGSATTQAVIAFQKAKGLPEDGVAGAKTLAAVNAALANG